MNLKLVPFLIVLGFSLISYNSYAQDTDGDGTANNLDQDEDNDGIPDRLDGCSIIDIANTIGIGTPIATGASYAIDETTITYTTTHSTAFYGYVAGNQGDAIRFQGPVTNEQLQLSFSNPVKNVTFKLTDFDENEQLTVNAYDELNNLINLNASNIPFIGAWVDRTGNFFEHDGSPGESDGDDEADDAIGGAYFYFPDQISRIVFIYNTGSGQSLRFTELNYCLLDSDGDTILDYLDIDSDNDGIPDTVEAGGVDLDGDGYVENTTDNNGNGIPDIYDFRCTNAPAASGWATNVHNSVNTSNANDALGSGTFSYADIGVGGSIELEFSDIIPAGNNTTIRHVRQSGTGQLTFSVERSADGITYSNGENFLTNFDGTYSVLSYQLLSGSTQYIKITNLSSETLGIDFAKYNFGLGANCSGINGVQIINLDTDQDGIPNIRDLDSDNDGIFDVIEVGLPDSDANGLADNFTDTDGDGYNDNYDSDVGNDGIAENLSSAAIITGSDTDSDGIPNSYPNANFDSNGYPNPYDIDTDDDGIPDNVEAQPTIGYMVPAGTFNSNGTDTAYASGITPEDTDGDGTPDYLDTDSDNDGTPDIQENGDVNTASAIDIDGDGLDDIFDNNTASFDVNDEITSGTTADLTASFGDIDGDLVSGGDLDFRDLFAINPPPAATIDFDGVDDYVEQLNSAINGLNEYTISFWFKYDGPVLGGSDEVFLMGQKGIFEIFLRQWGSGSNPALLSVNAGIYQATSLRQASGRYFIRQNWSHFSVTVTRDPGTGTIEFNVYSDGFQSGLRTVTNTVNTNTNPFRIGMINGITSTNNFTGNVDELKIFNKALTKDQIQRMVYQEIENNAGNVHGTIINKDIVDESTNATIPWTDLISYFPMSNIKTGKVIDESPANNSATLHNITTLMPQTAPLPFETVADGSWTSESTWLHGDIWNIEDMVSYFGASNQSPEPWSIVKIHHNVSTSLSHRSLGLFIDPDKTLTVTGDNSILNNWYLKLDGALDLADDSQLIQSSFSDLVTSANGKILRRQEGNADVYWYNYWASPVGSLASTTLIDNNTTSNNTNNTTFNLDMIKDGNGIDLQFTSAFDETGKISDQWLYSFLNGQTYYDWITLTPNTTIAPGVGYTQKGTGNAGTEQQYIFEGKPNNGTILIPADDIDGDSANESEQDVTLTTTLIGNPYPSALDADEFIRDNIDFDNGGANPIIQGTILLWEQWAGTSHWLAEYEGGYGYINLTETARAYQHPDIVIADPTNPDNRGIKTPTKFLPVGQAFFVEVVNDGDIQFNNGQRVFKTESTGESVFFRGTQEDTSVQDDATTESRVDEMSILRLEFGVSNGASRSFVLGFSNFTTDGFDYGYDGGLITNPPADDMGSLLNGQQYVIQAFAQITPEKEVSLVMHSSGNFTHTLKSTEITNIPESQALFIRDNLTGEIYDLRSTEPYNFTSEAGTFTNRFEVVFSDPTLSVGTQEIEDVVIYTNRTTKMLFIKGLDQEAKSLSLTNMLGQTVKTFNNIQSDDLNNGVYIGQLSSGVYFTNIEIENDLRINKKILIKN